MGGLLQEGVADAVASWLACRNMDREFWAQALRGPMWCVLGLDNWILAYCQGNLVNCLEITFNGTNVPSSGD